MSTIAKRKAAALIQKYAAEPPVPVEMIAQKEGAQIDYRELEDDVSGLLVRKDGQSIIIVNTTHAKTRQRFTIGHELAHLLLHRNSPAVFVDNYFVHFREDRTVRRYDRREVQANAFAASLLMPEHFLRAELVGKTIDISDDDAIREIARRYAVSPLALGIRLVDLGLADGLPGLARTT